MRYLSIILLLFFFSCKTKAKTENKIDKSVYEMWNSYVDENPQFKNVALPESYFFHDNEKDANRLAKLILNGKKKAGSGLYYLYKQANADLPIIGTKSIITNFNGKAQAIIKTMSVDTIPFNKISKAYAALDMGTDIEPLKKWKKAHWEFFTTVMEESGEKPTKDLLVVCEQFDVIWPVQNK